jgi:hypothetical protein
MKKVDGFNTARRRPFRGGSFCCSDFSLFSNRIFIFISLAPRHMHMHIMHRSSLQASRQAGKQAGRHAGRQDGPRVSGRQGIASPGQQVFPLVSGAVMLSWDWGLDWIAIDLSLI